MSHGFGSDVDRYRFEDNFFHHSKLLLERVGFTASRENTALLPLHVRLTNLRLGEKSS